MPESLERFRTDVCSILTRLYDYAYLETHRLGRLLSPERGIGGASRADELRRTILRAIEEMIPPEKVSIHSREWRAYNILCMRYVDVRSPHDVMSELALSERHFYREQKRAIDALVTLLWEKHGLSRDDTLSENSEGNPFHGSLSEEIASLLPQRETLGLADVLVGVLRAISPLCAEHRVTVISDLSDEGPFVYMNRTVLRQILLQVLGSLVTCDQVDGIRLSAQERDGLVWVEITCDCDASGPVQEHIDLSAALELIAAVGGEVTLDAASELGQFLLCFSLPSDSCKTLIVVEDNPGAIRLLRRYLSKARYEIVASDGDDELFSIIDEVQPYAILLDVMLPNQDGWELLRRIRSSFKEVHIPIVVCTVLDQKELAMALGADAYLRKPFSQQHAIEVLEAL